ncbi:MAG: UDP-N-acetylmuramoyl-tripeptide--D-alanyl-D-alanine ligase [Candidatus Woesebacteria bacterium]
MSLSIETKLAILQQTEYEWSRYIRWFQANKNSSLVVKPKKWTFKLQLLRVMAPVLSLRFSLLLLEIPKKIIIWAYVLVATIKLRYLQKRGLKVIAIAGSYGKTSTKYIAHHVLSGSRKILMTPENINTPIGIARLILSKLNSSHEVFLAELGEYYPGDIAGLVHFLSPDYKILTPVGYAHMERFGSEENLKKALTELVTTEANKGKHFVYGKDYGENSVTDVQVSRAGTEFSYNERSFFIPLYGKHNAVNTLPALWLAQEFGIDLNMVAQKLSSVAFIPHRLEPTLLEHNILLLDNGYNANPASSVETLSVVKELEASQKIIFTPGYIELGDIQEHENEKLGKRIAQIADVCVVIIGVNTQAIVKGLKTGGLEEDQIILAKGEQEGMEQIKNMVKPSAIILFENSVPELYK